MKKLSSPTFAFDETGNAAAAGCLSGMLRRFRCGQNPGDAEEFSVVESRSSQPPPPPPGSPSIVARLMGLDAMPLLPSCHDQPLRRSRSASSAESWPCSADLAPPPRIKTSASFREAPVYLRQENEDFLLLSFSPERKKDGFLASRTEAAERSVKNSGAKRERKSRRKQCARCKIEECVELELEAAQSRVQMECNSSQNSSPVSVLDPPDSHESSSSSMEEPSSPGSEEMKPTPKKQTSRRKLSSDFDHFSRLSPPRTCQGSQDGDKVVATQCDAEEKNRRVLKKTEVISPDVTGIWQHIGRLVEQDLKNMTWIIPRDDGKIAAEIGLEILDQLLCEATSELSFYTVKL